MTTGTALQRRTFSGGRQITRAIYQREETEPLTTVTAAGYFTYNELPPDLVGVGDFVEVVGPDYIAVLRITADNARDWGVSTVYSVADTERIPTVTELRQATGDGPFILADGSIWTTDGTTGHTFAEDDGVSAVVDTSGRLWTRKPIAPADATTGELRAARTLIVGQTDVYLPHFLNDGGINADDWTQACRAAIAQTGITGGAIECPHTEIPINGNILIDRPGVKFVGKSFGFLGDFAGNPKFFGPTFVPQSGVDWGTFETSGPNGVFTMALDTDLFDVSSDPTVRPRIFSGFENVNFDGRLATTIPLVQNYGAMYMQVDKVAFIRGLTAIKMNSRAGFTPGSPNNFTSSKVIIQSMTGDAANLAAQDGGISEWTVGNCGRLVLNSMSNFIASEMKVWNSIGDEGVRITNAQDVRFSGLVYDCNRSGIGVYGAETRVTLDATVQGCNRSNLANTDPALVSGLYIDDDVQRVTGFMDVDCRDGYQKTGTPTGIGHYGIYSDGALTDTRQLRASAVNALTDNFLILGRSAYQAQTKIIVDENPKTVFFAGIEGAVWEVLAVHKGPGGQSNAARAVVVGDTTTPEILEESTLGAAVFDFTITNGSLQIASTSTTDRTTTLSWSRVS